MACCGRCSQWLGRGARGSQSKILVSEMHNRYIEVILTNNDDLFDNMNDDPKLADVGSEF